MKTSSQQPNRANTGNIQIKSNNNNRSYPTGTGKKRPADNKMQLSP